MVAYTSIRPFSEFHSGLYVIILWYRIKHHIVRCVVLQESQITLIAESTNMFIEIAVPHAIVL